MKVLVCGDREWKNAGTILLALHDCGATSVIHGGCRGADMLGDLAAKKLGLPVTRYPARWKEYGRAAGPERNQRMLDEGKPDLVIAFHPDLTKSKGTADMVRRAKRAGVRTVVID